MVWLCGFIAWIKNNETTSSRAIRQDNSARKLWPTFLAHGKPLNACSNLWHKIVLSIAKKNKDNYYLDTCNFKKGVEGLSKEWTIKKNLGSERMRQRQKICQIVWFLKLQNTWLLLKLACLVNNYLQNSSFFHVFGEICC